MPISGRQKMQDLLHNSDGYYTDKEFFLNLITQYKNTTREKTYELHDFFTEHAIINNWSRRKLNALIDELFIDISKDSSYSEDIKDLLSNYLDALEGNCHWEYVIRLNNDPIDQLELSAYVRSREWMNQDFYLE